MDSSGIIKSYQKRTGELGKNMGMWAGPAKLVGLGKLRKEKT